ncbi:MAG: hypothetical protein KatS3mg104_2129 [Phycisphaerae bacterium]|jgi:HPt (histidine-containing phosphotransfer) domain-containing protein|nr:MAG: hypothetical protein KatS3mg104_2129 [Phycisphaerae bacterium]
MSDSDMIDREELLQRCLGDAEFARQMLWVFCESAQKTVPALTQAWEQGDWDQVRRSAHTLKGSAGNLSIPELRSQAQEVEQLVDQSEVEELKARKDGFMDCLNRSIRSAELLAARLMAESRF